MLKTLSGWLAGAAVPATTLAAAPFPLKKTAAEWKQIVSPAAYRVLFEHGTEPAGDTGRADVGERRHRFREHPGVELPRLAVHIEIGAGEPHVQQAERFRGGAHPMFDRQGTRRKFGLQRRCAGSCAVVEDIENAHAGGLRHVRMVEHVKVGGQCGRFNRDLAVGRLCEPVEHRSHAVSRPRVTDEPFEHGRYGSGKRHRE